CGLDGQLRKVVSLVATTALEHEHVVAGLREAACRHRAAEPRPDDDRRHLAALVVQAHGSKSIPANHASKSDVTHGSCNSVRSVAAEDLPDPTPLLQESGVEAAEQRRLAPGTVLVGRFELEAKLGEGGMGHVFAGLDRERKT